MTPKNDTDALRDRVQRLGFFGLLASWSEIIDIEGASYRLKEAKERAAAKAAARTKRRVPGAEKRA